MVRILYEWNRQNKYLLLSSSNFQVKFANFTTLEYNNIVIAWMLLLWINLKPDKSWWYSHITPTQKDRRMVIIFYQQSYFISVYSAIQVSIWFTACLVVIYNWNPYKFEALQSDINIMLDKKRDMERKVERNPRWNISFCSWSTNNPWLMTWAWLENWY